MGWAKDFLQKTTSVKGEVSRETYGSQALFSEWRQDYAMAKLRDETGREPVATNPSPVGDKIVAPERAQETTVSQGSLRQDLVDSGWKLSRHDEHALSVYEKHCNGNSLVANPHDAGDWLKGTNRQTRRPKAIRSRLRRGAVRRRNVVPPAVLHGSDFEPFQLAI
jgi:hypothetical protein